MNINRNNYEEYFLMYADNELPVHEMRAVKLFLQQNPDLAEEMSLLQQSVLLPEKIIYSNKQTLIKSEIIDETELLLYVDNELSIDKTKAVELKCAKSEKMAAALTLFQQTKLTPDTSIIFQQKSSLYKKEKTEIVFLPWFRIAAAAIFIGFGIWGAVSFLNHSNHNNVAINNTPKLPLVKPSNSGINIANQQTHSSKNPVINIINEQQHKNKDANPSTLLNNQQSIAVEKRVISNDIKNVQPLNRSNELTTVEKDNSEKNNQSNNLNISPKQAASLSVQQINNQNKNLQEIIKPNSADQPLQQKKEVAIQTNPIAVTSALVNANDEQSDTRILYVSTEKIKKSKLGKFLGKLKNTISIQEKPSASRSISIGNVEIAFH